MTERQGQFEALQDSSQRAGETVVRVESQKRRLGAKTVALLGAGAILVGGTSAVVDNFLEGDNKISEFATPNSPDLGVIGNIPVIGDLITDVFESETNPFELVEAGEQSLEAELTYGLVERKTQFSGVQDTYARYFEGSRFEKHNLRESVAVDLDLTTTYTVSGEDISLGYYPQHEKYYIQVDDAELVGTGATYRREENINRSQGTRIGQRWGDVTNTSEVGQQFQDDIAEYFETTPNTRIHEVAMCQGALAVGAVWTIVQEVQEQYDTTGAGEEISVDISEEEHPFDDDVILRLSDLTNPGAYNHYTLQDCRDLIENETSDTLQPLDEQERQEIQQVLNVNHQTRASVAPEILGLSGEQNVDTNGNVTQELRLRQVTPASVEQMRAIN